jgi:hypothetical protein
MLAVVLGQAPAPAAAIADDDATARLVLMKRSVGEYKIHRAEDTSETYRLQPEPSLRYTNSVGASKDGAVFLWLGENGRPEVAAQVFLRRDGAWWQELSSLAVKPIVADWQETAIWSPRTGGVELKPIPGAPRPADTPEQRLRQMHALTQEFTVEDDFRRQSWQTLRKLAKPFARYGKPGSAVTDGALFTYVLTTDPEVYLMLEARAGSSGLEWHYAFAPMTVYPVRGSWKGTEVWSLPYRGQTANDPDESFHLRPFPVAE